MRVSPVVLAALACNVGLARAEDVTITQGISLEYAFQGNGTDTQDKPNVNATLEVERAHLFAGIWAEASSDKPSNEIDLYAGYRNETAGGLGYAFSYTYFLFPNDSVSNHGEFGLELEKDLTDQLSGDLTVAYDAKNKLGNAYLELELALNDKWSASGTYGIYEVAGAGAEREWDAGISYGLSDTTDVDLRYYDGSEYTTDYIGLNLNWEITKTVH